MNKISKILVTTGVIIIFIIVTAFITALMGHEGHHGPGILGLIAMGALIGALKAIWKKPSQKEKDDNNHNPILQQ
ncbi:MAG: hypothetical protein MR678_07575 [Muribaculaceae bacterium]|nr:hypothetical protein [Muribaculaceae bacterium]